MKLDIAEFLKSIGLLGAPHVEYGDFEELGNGEIYLSFIDMDSLAGAVENGKKIAAAIPADKELWIWAPAMGVDDIEMSVDNWPIELARKVLRDNTINEVTDEVIARIAQYGCEEGEEPWITFTINDKEDYQGDGGFGTDALIADYLD